MGKCEETMAIFSRVVGYYSDKNNWHKSKQEEFRMRKTFNLDKALTRCAEDKAKKSVFST